MQDEIDLTHLLGAWTVTKEVLVKNPFGDFTLKTGETIKVIKTDSALDRVLIEVPNGKIDWKRLPWLTQHSSKISQ